MTPISCVTSITAVCFSLQSLRNSDGSAPGWRHQARWSARRR
jgi:hypothetical protein